MLNPEEVTKTVNEYLKKIDESHDHDCQFRRIMHRLYPEFMQMCCEEINRLGKDYDEAVGLCSVVGGISGLFMATVIRSLSFDKHEEALYVFSTVSMDAFMESFNASMTNTNYTKMEGAKIGGHA